MKMMGSEANIIDTEETDPAEIKSTPSRINQSIFYAADLGKQKLFVRKSNPVFLTRRYNNYHADYKRTHPEQYQETWQGQRIYSQGFHRDRFTRNCGRYSNTTGSGRPYSSDRPGAV